MKTPRYTIDNLHQQFPDDNTCLDHIFQLRFGGMVACPKCCVTEPKYYRVRSKKVYECKDCGNQISPLANTIFHKSETPLKKWFYAMYMFTVSRNGVSGKELERTLGVTYKTAWRMCKQIRFMMSLLRPVASQSTITLQLSTDGGFVLPYHFGYFRLIVTYFQQCRNLVSLSLGKLYVAHKRSFDLAVFRGLSYRSLPLSTIKVALVS
jgi:transposase-like protein